MLKTKQDIICKIHLIISVVIVIPVAIIYGFFPNLYVDIFPETIDEHNFQKAIMGLYLGFASLWLMGVYKAGFLKMALVSNSIFMLGLGLGRVLSLCLDGLPTFVYVFGTAAEIGLGLYGIWVLKRFNPR